MSQIVSTQAIIVQVAPYKEHDLRVVALTRTYGIVDAIAIGAQKSVSKQRARLEMGIITSLDIAKGRRADKILRSEPIQVPNQIRRSLKKITALQFFCGLLKETNHKGDVVPDVYLFAAKALVALERLQEEKTSWWCNAVATRILETAGYGVVSGKSLRQQMEFHFEKRLQSWEILA